MKSYKVELLAGMRKLISSYCASAKSQIEQQWASAFIDGDAELSLERLDTDADTIARSLCAWGQKAWITEFGKGSLMDTSGSENPFLDDYINSSQFNKARKGHALAVVGRPKGKYTDLDGNEHYSSGNLSGVVIEDMATSQGYPYSPIRGKHVIQTVINEDIEMLQNEIQELAADILMRLLQEFPKELDIC